PGARPPALIAAHPLEAALLAESGDGRSVSRERCRGLAEERADLGNDALCLALHPLVRHKQNVRRASLRIPRQEVLEVAAEVHLARDEALEEIVERAFREIVVLHEASCV